MKIKTLKKGLREEEIDCPNCARTLKLWFDKKGSVRRVVGGEVMETQKEKNAILCHTCHGEYEIEK